MKNMATAHRRRVLLGATFSLSSKPLWSVSQPPQMSEQINKNDEVNNVLTLSSLSLSLSPRSESAFCGSWALSASLLGALWESANKAGAFITQFVRFVTWAVLYYNPSGKHDI